MYGMENIMSNITCKFCEKKVEISGAIMCNDCYLIYSKLKREVIHRIKVKKIISYIERRKQHI